MEQIMTGFGIPLPSINIMAANTTIAMDFDNVQDLHSNTTADSNGTGILCVLGPISLGMSYNTSTKLTTGVVLGLCNHQASRLISLVQSVAEASRIPMMLPLILINILNETRAHRVMGRKQAISHLEVDLGVHWNSQADLRARDMSLEAATRRLTMYGSEVAWDVHAIEAQMDMVILITEVQDAIKNQDTALDDKSAAMVAFRARSRRIRQVLSGLMHWTRYNQQRIQIQLQTIYSFTSQRDNDLSYRTAVASQRIAEATQRDGVLMKQLAAQSKALALRTWRDGVDMRAMAVITLITLPGTFTATLFSTSFFNFEPASSGEHVSSWIWLYFVVTLAFTAICLFGWYYSSQTMVQAAEKSPIEGEVYEGEKMKDTDSRIHSAHGTQTEDAQSSSPPTLRPPPGRVSLDQNWNSNDFPVTATAKPFNHSPSDDTLTRLASDSVKAALARARWDVTDAWGTQSYGQSRKACAMCAQHIE